MYADEYFALIEQAHRDHNLATLGRSAVLSTVVHEYPTEMNEPQINAFQLVIGGLVAREADIQDQPGLRLVQRAASTTEGTVRHTSYLYMEYPSTSPGPGGPQPKDYKWMDGLYEGIIDDGNAMLRALGQACQFAWPANSWEHKDVNQ
jgi:hypothetical protein